MENLRDIINFTSHPIHSSITVKTTEKEEKKRRQHDRRYLESVVCLHANWFEDLLNMTMEALCARWRETFSELLKFSHVGCVLSTLLAAG